MELLPWENRKKHGLFYALFLSIKELFTQPLQYFQKVPVGHGYLNPILFIWFFVMLTTTLALVLQMALSVPIVFSEEIMQKVLSQQTKLTNININQIYFAMWLIMPIARLVNTFMMSVITYLVLSLILKQKTPFELTFRIIAFAEGSSIFFLVPEIGIFIAFACNLFFIMTGMKAIFNLSKEKAFLTILPIIGLFIFLFLLT